MKVSVQKQKRSSKSKDSDSSKNVAPPTPVDFDVSDSSTVLDLKEKIHKKLGILVVQQRLSVDGGKKVLKDSDIISSLGLDKNESILLKDLGKQISWKTVFLIEYGGPIIIHYLIYNLPSIFYLKSFEHSNAQYAMYLMAIAHYVKRELETLFVHRFSHATMPFTNLFKNCFHYYVLGGILLAYFNYMPQFGKGSPFDLATSSFSITIAVLLFIVFELSNLSTHVTLMNLRPAGSTVRKIPYGYGFNLVSCPNYLFEILSWVSFSIISPSYFSWLFIIVSSGQMYLWALKKHSQYKKEFPDYPKNRTAIFPFIA
ncbi:putative enoyl reductase [Smittium culicis]|uniref:Putative enoyl reductase n=2 Tax=Smittium culicis TaxID=133412 RepID=A0A1R1XRD6_9FUNG|nr:putative enoyl reductase [Smittium culicis]